MKNGDPMPVFKASFTSTEEVESILANGVHINNLFIKPEKYSPAKQPTRCYNCQKFGHTASFCKGGICCNKCSGKHKTSECTNDDKQCKLQW